ncbi:MAG: phosphatase PAP2 family protein [Acidobacteriia bacterium]|nr:phosphatase PAP2 family protein [Terriglobia bacterium]
MIRFEYSIVQTIILVGTILLLVRLMVPRIPMGEIFRQIRERLPQTGYVLCLLAALVVSLIDYVEAHFDARVTQAIQKDYTPFVSRFGTTWVEHIQRHRSVVATYLFTYTYIWIFPAIMFAVFFVLVYDNREEVAQFLVAAYFTNLLFVLPFYLFFPVNEVWVSDPHVRLLIDRISPLVMEHFRSISALDNCFPSFHTSLALLIAMAAWRSGRSRVALLATLASLMVIVSTLYLGIHWPLDLLSGGVAAILCGSLSFSYAPSMFSRAALRFEQLRQFATDKISA